MMIGIDRAPSAPRNPSWMNPMNSDRTSFFGIEITDMERFFGSPLGCAPVGRDPDLLALPGGLEGVDRHRREGVLPLRTALAGSRLEHQVNLRVGAEYETEQGAVNHVRTGFTVPGERLGEKAEALPRLILEEVLRDEILGQQAHLP